MTRGARDGMLRIKRKPQSFGTRTAEPLRAVLLTIDAARRSGVATYVCGRLHHYAEADATHAPWRRLIVRDAITMAEVRNLPLAAVIEVPFGGHVGAALSLAGSVELWRDTWRSAGRSPDRMLECTANEWRRALLGRAGMPRAQARRIEQEIASQTVQRDLQHSQRRTLGADEAAAICIGQVAICSSAVAQRLGLSMLGRSYTP